MATAVATATTRQAAGDGAKDSRSGDGAKESGNGDGDERCDSAGDGGKSGVKEEICDHRVAAFQRDCVTDF